MLLFFIRCKGQARANFQYITVAERVNKLSLIFYKFISTLFVIVLGMPFHLAFFTWICGTYSADVWFLPYKVLCVFKKTYFINIHAEKLRFNNKSSFLLPFILNFFPFQPQKSLPFDITTPIGYSVTLAIEIIGVLIIGGMICLVDSLFLSICWYHEALIDDLIIILRRFDRFWLNRNKHETIEEHSNADQYLLPEFIEFNCEIFR